MSADGQAAAAAAAGDQPPAPPASPPPPAPSAQQRPEVQVGLAFAGGLLAAMVLRRLGGR